MSGLWWGKGESRGTTVHYRAITVQGLPCLTFINILNTMYLVSSVYLDIRWVTTHPSTLLSHYLPLPYIKIDLCIDKHYRALP